MNNHPCLICGTIDPDKAMCFRTEDWCSENHRKMLFGKLPLPDGWKAPSPKLKKKLKDYAFLAA